MSPFTPATREAADGLAGEFGGLSERLQALGFQAALPSFTAFCLEFAYEVTERHALTHYGKKVADDLSRVHEIYRLERLT